MIPGTLYAVKKVNGKEVGNEDVGCL